jgi:hypothetical protein
MRLTAYSFPLRFASWQLGQIPFLRITLFGAALRVAKGGSFDCIRSAAWVTRAVNYDLPRIILPIRHDSAIWAAPL